MRPIFISASKAAMAGARATLQLFMRGGTAWPVLSSAAHVCPSRRILR
jgi:hypothetical protein